MSKDRPDSGRFSMVGPVVVGFGFGLSLVMLLQGVTLLSSWSTVYGGRGEFTVEDCSASSGRQARILECSGVLVPESDSRPLSSTLTGAQAAFGSTAPGAGTVIETYYRVGDTTQAYPLEGRTTVLARIVVGVVPYVFLVGGTAAWLLGCLLTRHIAKEDAELSPFHYRFPQRFGLRPRGTTWALVGLAWVLFDRLAVDQLLGAAVLG